MSGIREYKVLVGRRAAVALLVALAAVSTSAAFAGRLVDFADRVQVAPLRLAVAPTPPLPVPRYDTSGTYPHVHGSAPTTAVNQALRQAVLDEQRRYAPSARRAVRVSRLYRGVFQTSVVREYVSASTSVVSALLPLRELYPGGNDGDGWIAVTVRVPSGDPVTLGQLFTDPSVALPALAGAWLGRLTDGERTHCVVNYLDDYTPTLSHYRNYALTPAGIAVGFWQEPACERLAAIVPYSAIRHYLSPFGHRLIGTVRAPN